MNSDLQDNTEMKKVDDSPLEAPRIDRSNRSPVERVDDAGLDFAAAEMLVELKASSLLPPSLEEKDEESKQPSSTFTTSTTGFHYGKPFLEELLGSQVRPNSVPSASSPVVSSSAVAPPAPSKTISFGETHVREYERALAVHPCTRQGPSIGLGWNYTDVGTRPLQFKEVTPASSSDGAHQKKLLPYYKQKESRLSPSKRTIMLYNLGYNHKEMDHAIAEAQRPRHCAMAKRGRKLRALEKKMKKARMMIPRRRNASSSRMLVKPVKKYQSLRQARLAKKKMLVPARADARVPLAKHGIDLLNPAQKKTYRTRKVLIRNQPIDCLVIQAPKTKPVAVPIQTIVNVYVAFLATWIKTRRGTARSFANKNDKSTTGHPAAGSA